MSIGLIQESKVSRYSDCRSHIATREAESTRTGQADPGSQVPQLAAAVGVMGGHGRSCHGWCCGPLAAMSKECVARTCSSFEGTG